MGGGRAAPADGLVPRWSSWGSCPRWTENRGVQIKGLVADINGLEGFLRGFGVGFWRPVQACRGRLGFLRARRLGGPSYRCFCRSQWSWRRPLGPNGWSGPGWAKRGASGSTSARAALAALAEGAGQGERDRRADPVSAHCGDRGRGRGDAGPDRPAAGWLRRGLWMAGVDTERERRPQCGSGLVGDERMASAAGLGRNVGRDRDGLDRGGRGVKPLRQCRPFQHILLSRSRCQIGCQQRCSKTNPWGT